MDQLTFIGTATTLLRLGPFTVLTDPNLLHRGQRAYLGKGLWSRRLTEPALQPAQLPPLDAVVLSHLHGDHFDRVARRDLDRAAPVLTTPQASKHLTRWGFTTRPLRPWDRTVLERDDASLTVVALPAVHARGALGHLLPPVMGSMLTLEVSGQSRRRLYISGDTLTGAHIDQIARAYPTIDCAVVHLGGTRVLLHTVTMDDVQGVDLLTRLSPRHAVPVHFDDYRVFKSPLSSFVGRAAQAGLSTVVTTPSRGKAVPLFDPVLETGEP